MGKKYWLLTTEHLKDRLWFKDEDDFKVGMNYVAVLSATRPARIISFVLMSNHVHFILESTQEDAKNFINEFKTIYSKYFRRKYLSKELLRENKIDIKEVSTFDEGLERAIAYVQMNSVAANICLHPSGYPWGTGDCYFNNSPATGTFVGDLTGRAVSRMIHSKISLPSNYLVSEKGYIHPSSYVSIDLVESVFKTPKRMAFFLNNSSKAKRNEDLPSIPSFRDQTIALGLSELCLSIYGKKFITELNPEQTSEILKQLRYRFSADPNQLARVTGISYENISKLLDRC